MSKGGKFLTFSSIDKKDGVGAENWCHMALNELTELGVRHVMTCFDMDYLKNWHVEAAYSKLIQLLGGLPLTFGTYLWSPEYNGMDDYIWEFFMMKHHLD